MGFETRNRRAVHRGRAKLSGEMSGKCGNDSIERGSIERGSIERNLIEKDLIEKDLIEKDSIEREIQRELILLSVKKKLREAGIIEKTDNEISDEKD